MTPASDAQLILIAGKTLVFEPAGLHVMCIGLAEPLVEGTTAELEVLFDNVNPLVIEISIEVR